MSIVPYEDRGVRVAFNRDEHVIRPSSLAPRRFIFDQRVAAFPIDPQSHGTWIAGSDAGLIFGLLNLNCVECTHHSGGFSRGTVIPWLLHAACVEEALDGVSKLRLERIAAFRLVILDRERLAVVSHFGHRTEYLPVSTVRRPVMFTSSGLGDALVEAPRRELFSQLIRSGGSLRERQDAFHAHQWAGAEHLSVNMSRSDARTVSYTVIELSARQNQLNLTYHGAAPNVAIDDVAISLPLQVAVDT